MKFLVRSIIVFFGVWIICGLPVLADSQHESKPKPVAVSIVSPQHVEPTEVKIISEPPAPPSEVKIIGVPNPLPESSEQKKSRLSHEANEEGLTRYTESLASATRVLVVVAIFQALLFAYQLFYMREGLRDTAKSADAAKHSALATSQSVAISKQSMIVGYRAYVAYNGARWFSHRQEADNRLFWRILPMWINTGNSPTRDLKVVVKYALLDEPIDSRFDFTLEKPSTPARIAAHGVIVSAPFDVYGIDMAQVRDGTKHLYVWGVAWYRDVFPESPEHVTKFCVVATNLTGDPLASWHEKENPFDIKFMNYERHNCADEECGAYFDPRFADPRQSSIFS